MTRWIATIAAVTALAAASSALAQATPAPAAAPTVPDRNFGEWRLRCEKDACALIQAVTDDAHAEIGVTVAALKIDGAPILRIIAPLGVFLPAGVGLKIDQTDMGSVGFLRCTAEGCFAEAELAPEQVASFSTGQTATFNLMQNPTQGVAVPVSLKGFKEGLAALH